jgi:predicted ATPase
MTITAITLENFKEILEPVRVELKPITLLFGPNSRAKPTIVQALHYAREIFERQNLNPDRTFLGGSESQIHKHDLSLAIRVRSLSITS